MYFIWYPLSEAEIVRFATMKLTGQANEYSTDFVNKQVLLGQRSIETWDRMKEELEPSMCHHISEFRSLPFVQPNRSITLSSPSAKFTQCSKTRPSRIRLGELRYDSETQVIRLSPCTLGSASTRRQIGRLGRVTQPTRPSDSAESADWPLSRGRSGGAAVRP